LSFTNESYGRATSLISEKLRGGAGPPYNSPVPTEYFHQNLTFTPPQRKANAAIVILARNGDVQGVINSMKELEDRFNKKFRYDYVFLNEEKFSDRFIA
jgi:alpha 1,2-mannosyltransferase